MKNRPQLKANYAFFVVGYYGAGNLGDELILEIILERLEKYTSRNNICVTSYDHEYTKKRHGDVETVYPNDLYKVAEIIKNSSLILIGGGGLFSDDEEIFGEFDSASIFDSPTGGISLYFAYSIVAKLYGIPYITLSTSISNLKHSESELLLKAVLNDSKAVFMRDSNSVTYAKSLVDDKSIVMATSDPVFTLKGNEINQSNQKNVLVSAREWKSFSDSKYKEIGKVLKEFEDRGYFVTFLPFQAREFEFEDDRKAFERIIKDQSLTNYKIEPVPESYTEVCGVFKNANVILGMRLHSIILAMVFNRPFIAFSYDSKVEGLVADADLSKLCLYRGNARNTVDSFVANMEEIKNKIITYQKNAKSMSELPFKWISESLDLLPLGDYADLSEVSKKTSKQIKEDFYDEILYYKERYEIVKNEQLKLEYDKNILEQEKRDLKNSRILKYAFWLVGLSKMVRSKKRAYFSRAFFLKKIRSITPRFIVFVVRKFINILWPKKIVFIKNEYWPEDKPLVTIVTPYFNNGKTIEETARSVLGQSFARIEYIVVNDGSDEENSKILSSISKQGIEIIHFAENIGKGSPAAARNAGIKKARGKYIVCLDADDILDPTFIEKLAAILESRPWLGLVTCDTNMFGAIEKDMLYVPYNAAELLTNNMVITAAMFRKSAWKAVDGYKLGIGYEDWEFWINLAEYGYRGIKIDEKLFNYRTAQSSRYIEDKLNHRENVEKIIQLHKHYSKNVANKDRLLRRIEYRVDSTSLYKNLDKPTFYNYGRNNRPSILVSTPWMTFGGAETLIYNFCSEIKNEFNIHFVTGLKSTHEWEYKFKEISSNIYHLANLFDDEESYFEFISNYIHTRKIDVLHIIHNSFMFGMLPELKRRCPKLKVVVTVFNDKAHFKESLEAVDHVDLYSTDNNFVAEKYRNELGNKKIIIKTIPNGINNKKVFNPSLFDRKSFRKELGLSDNDLAIFYIGRLSEEKNPDVFVQSAQKVLGQDTNGGYKFFIIGDGPMKKELKKEIKKYSSENIRYLGYQNNIAMYLSAADVFVLPSSTEGFPLSILEAMAMGVAVISSRVGAVPDIIREEVDGFIVTPGSAEEISSVIMQLKQDTKLLQKIKDNSRNKIEKQYSSTILGDNYKELYNSLN